MNTPSHAMVSRAPSGARCPVPQSGRTFIVAMVVSLALHTVAIAGAGLWVAYAKPRSNEAATCPVTQFMKVHLIKAPAAPAPKPVQQLAAIPPAATAKPITKPKTRPAKTQPAPIQASTHPLIHSSAAPAAPHSDFIAEAAQPQPAALHSSTHLLIHSSPVLAKVQAGTNTAITYPAAARKNGWEGTVTLHFWLNESGRPSKLRIANSSGFPVLDAKALQTVKSWRFQQSATWAELPVAFQLTQN